MAQEYYDVTDPFIDDSELAVDERTFFAQTKQQGFYVSSGQVALLTDKCVLLFRHDRLSRRAPSRTVCFSCDESCFRRRHCCNGKV